MGNFFMANVGLKVVHNLREELISSLIYQPMSFFDLASKGEIVNRIIFTTNQITGAATNALKILAKEGREGTKKMLSELKKNSDGILIKLPKKKQDLRIDLPTVGLQTFKDIKKYGLRGIVLQAKKNIFLDKVKCIKFANKNRMFISVK